MLEALRNELASGKFELSLSQIELRQCGADGGRTYSGAGFATQQSDGKLKLRMFATEKLTVAERFKRIFPQQPVPGVILPDTHFFDLEAVDQNGARWRAGRQSISEKFGTGNEIHVLLSRLEKVESVDRPATTRSAGWFIPGRIDLPWHVATTTDRGWTLDRFEFEDDTFIWKAHKAEGGLEVQLTVKTGPLEPHATNFMRSLGMLVGRAMEPRISYAVGDGEIVTRIHPQTLDESSNLTGPIPLRVQEHRDAHRFLAGCMSLTQQPFHENDPLRVLYQFWHRILRAQQKDIENSALVLSVAIEGTLKELFHSEYDVDSVFASLVAEALPIVEKLLVSDRIRNALLSSLSNSVSPKPKDSMERLKQQGGINQSHITAWKKLRNTGAHGTLLNEDDEAFQKHLDRYFCCLDLFYRLIFLVTGYRGRHTNFSESGWPQSEFPPSSAESQTAR